MPYLELKGLTRTATVTALFSIFSSWGRGALVLLTASRGACPSAEAALEALVPTWAVELIRAGGLLTCAEGVMCLFKPPIWTLSPPAPHVDLMESVLICGGFCLATAVVGLVDVGLNASLPASFSKTSLLTLNFSNCVLLVGVETVLPSSWVALTFSELVFWAPREVFPGVLMVSWVSLAGLGSVRTLVLFMDPVLVRRWRVRRFSPLWFSCVVSSWWFAVVLLLGFLWRVSLTPEDGVLNVFSPHFGSAEIT